MNQHEKETFQNAAFYAIQEYKEKKVVSLEIMQTLFDCLKIDVKIDPLDRSDQAVLVLLLALATR